MKTTFEKLRAEAEKLQLTSEQELAFFLGYALMKSAYDDLINNLVCENQGLKLYKDNEKERMVVFGEYLQNREDAICTIEGVYNDFLKEHD